MIYAVKPLGVIVALQEGTLFEKFPATQHCLERREAGRGVEKGLREGTRWYAKAGRIHAQDRLDNAQRLLAAQS